MDWTVCNCRGGATTAIQINTATSDKTVAASVGTAGLLNYKCCEIYIAYHLRNVHGFEGLIQ
ncbi:MAG: hypothetical protein ACXWJF_06650, partial [Burkholderiaceae bacterium]